MIVQVGQAGLHVALAVVQDGKKLVFSVTCFYKRV